MHKLNEAVKRQRWLSNDGIAAGPARPPGHPDHQLTGAGRRKLRANMTGHDGRINRNQISPQGISDRGKIKSRQDDDDGEIVYQSDYPVSSDVFVSLLEAAASYLHHEQLKVANGWQRQISSLGGTDSTSAKVAAEWRGYSRSL